MSKLPKLKIIKSLLETSEEVWDFEQGKNLPFYCAPLLVVVEGQVVDSFNELAQLASKDQYKDREFLTVKFTAIPTGG